MDEPVKKYLIFAGVWYYPSGGANDFRLSFDSMEEAMGHDLARIMYTSGTMDKVDWAQLAEFDGKILKVLFRRELNEVWDDINKNYELSSWGPWVPESY